MNEPPSPRSFAERVSHTQRSVRSARLRARLPRYLALAIALVLIAAGLRSVIAPADPPPAASSPELRRDPAAEDFALQFARAYLTYDAAKPEAHQHALAPFLSSDLDPDAGFAPARGTQAVLWAEVSSNQPALAGGRVITIAAQTDSNPQPLYLAVTVRHDRGQPLNLVGYPSLVGAPAVASDAPVPERATVEDAAVSEVAARVVRNYLAGQADDLHADLTPDAAVTLPTVSLAVQSTDQVVWAGSAPSSGAVLVTVTATDPAGATYRLTYELGIAHPDASERPYVDFVEVVPTGT